MRAGKWKKKFENWSNGITWNGYLRAMMGSRFRTVDRGARGKEMGKRGAKEGDELQEVRKP